jgi:outer membrane protein assembly factor BamA
VDTLIAQAINYRLAADFLQPRWFGTRTSIGASAYTERISELGLYVRTALGGQVGVIRQVAPFTVFSTTFTVERGSTQASDFFFCVAYEVCEPGDIATLKEPRWSNFLSLGLLRNRVRLDPFPSGGYQLRLGTDYASAFIGSEDEYLRVLGDGSVYRELREDWVLQLRLTGGTFLEGVVGDGFIPPQRRFYAGGATTVRGYRRNQLGPLVYIRRVRPDEGDDDEKPDVDLVASGTGGTGMVVGTAELTAPSPFFRENLRLAAFVDGGRVWSSDTLTSDPSLRFTPGVGLRYASPVGPLRADLAYNPYGCVPGPLFKITESGTLEGPLETAFVPSQRRICARRVTLHLSIGTAF